MSHSSTVSATLSTFVGSLITEFLDDAANFPPTSNFWRSEQICKAFHYSECCHYVYLPYSHLFFSSKNLFNTKIITYCYSKMLNYNRIKLQFLKEILSLVDTNCRCIWMRVCKHGCDI